MQKNWIRMFGLLMVICAIPAFGLDGVPDKFKVWTSEWDSNNPETGYYILEWTYDKANDFWDVYDQMLEKPLVVGKNYEGSIYDMGMDMIQLADNYPLSAILTVSMGTSHFPSTGTEFQHRQLTTDLTWKSVQAPLFTTPSDVSPLGVDIYKAADGFHIVWVEDNDAAGPASLMCEIYDSKCTLNADGTLALEGTKTKVYSKKLNWSATHPGSGGVNGVVACDYDGDNDIDYVISQMFYGDKPSSSSLSLLEQTAPGVYSTTLKEIHWTATGNGAEALTCCDIDGDDNLDFMKTNETDGTWSQVFWYEKEGETLVLRGMVIDCGLYAGVWGLSSGHIFGLYANEPAVEVTTISDWALF